MSVVKVNAKLARQIAELLACKDATHPMFMVQIDDELRGRGYRFSAEQEGIRGTFLTVKPCALRSKCNACDLRCTVLYSNKAGKRKGGTMPPSPRHGEC